MAAAMLETTECLPKKVKGAETETMATTDLWSRLPGDILNSIAERLNKASSSSTAGPSTQIDATRLRSVCKSWRSEIVKSWQSSSFSSMPPLKLPFPMIPNENIQPDRCGHFSLTQSTIYFLQPPSATTTVDGCGWLLRVEEPPSENNHLGTKKYHPLNPLTQISTKRVPTIGAFPESLNLLDVGVSEIGKAYSLKYVDTSKKKMENGLAGEGEAPSKYVKKSMQSVLLEYSEAQSIYVKKSAVSPDYGFVVAIQGGRLCSFKLGVEQEWNPINFARDKYHDVVYRCKGGEFYAVDYRGRTVAVSGSEHWKEEPKVIASPLPGLGACQFTRLVESGDDLFLVDKYVHSEPRITHACTSQGAITSGFITEENHHETNVFFNLYRLNELNKQWELVDDLNHMVFILGDDYSISVSAQDFPALKGNCIYFSDCTFGERNIEEVEVGNFAKSCVLTSVYSLNDGSCGPLALSPDLWPIFSTPPAWLKPKHHHEVMPPLEEMKLRRDATTLKQVMPELTPQAKQKAAEAKLVGDDAYKRRDYLMAYDAYTQAIGFDPTNATLFSNRSVCWIHMGQAEHALTDAKACRALRPDWPKACYREGAALKSLQKFEEAAKSFREGVTLDPENQDLLIALREAVEAGKKVHGIDR